jgi:hypothetical protein
MFLTYLKRKGVYINYAQLGMFDTSTLGWIGEAHPSLSFRDKMKDRIEKMTKSDYGMMKYSLFPRAFHYITEQNVKMTALGIALQITKNDDVPVVKFREDMVRKLQDLDE